MWFYKKLLVFAFIKYAACGLNTIEDRGSEMKDASYQRNVRRYHLDNLDGLKSFHVDESLNNAHKTILFADCFDIDMGPMAKQSLRFVFGLGKINWTIDSVATSPKYVGKPLTKRMGEFLRSRNQTLRGHRVRLITEDDFRKADWILAIDDRTLEYLNKIKPKDSKALIETWNNYDFYKDGHQDLLEVDNLKEHQDYLNSYWHNLRLAVIFLGNLRCRKCYPIDFKLSEKYWDDVQA